MDWIETDIFVFETPLCKESKEFNHLLQIDIDIDIDVLTRDLPGLKIYEDYKIRGSMSGIIKCHGIGIKSLLNAVEITAAHVCVNVTQLELVMLMNFNEKYTKCLLLLVRS
uniref:Uncharacterized protein n=1 Tax=Tanacetum cinerariifolium TaxID=118510 RepID=A0A699T284_TANCI|nr:hypothetical protein [Tanacetum cinerariifolium]